MDIPDFKTCKVIKIEFNKQIIDRCDSKIDFRVYIANCLEIQVKNHYTQTMSYDRDLRLRALEYAKEHGNQFLSKSGNKS